ncbi:57_t:CDS:2 [Paraglomus brasilianum]|uniref:57_t:CDS:1 n=1 Tax=Paraglomus brasilianum TaxID=144538 RepID=A0A9N9B8Q6_9GLOM|nr:57_t:CDS:2 [Paraglomus brasilianum]
MSGRIVVATIGIAYLLYCIFVAIVTFLGKNVATLHLNSSYYKLAFAALYAVLSPFGLSGILGAIHRRKNLIKGFLWQYWVGTLLISGANAANVIYTHAKGRDIFRECGSERLFDPSAVPDCNEFVRTVRKNAFIAAIAQGSAMILIGLLLLIVGGREFNDIKIDEETSNLLDKGLFENKDKPEPFGRIVSPVNPPETAYTTPTVPFRTPANKSSPYGAYGLDDRKASLASTAYGLEHKPSIASSTSSYGQNAYGRRRPTMNGGRDMYLTPNPMNGGAQPAPARSQGLYRQPTSSSTYSDRTLHSPPLPDIPYERIPTQTTRPPYIKPPERSYANDGPSNSALPYLTYGAQGGQQPADDYDNYWQPAAAKTLASNVNRMNMY